MEDDEQTVSERASGSKMQRPLKSYSFLLGLSKKLGMVATSSFVEVRDFLSNDMPLSFSKRSNTNSSIRNENANDSSVLAEKEKVEASKKGETEVDASQQLEDVVKQSRDVLAIAKTVFPMTLFPDVVFVDRTKVTIIRRSFFWSEEVMSIRIEDVLNVSASVGPLFGSLTIASRVMSTIDHFKINYFWRNDASHLKHIIQGYVIAQHNKLDTAHLEKEELIKTLVELGHDQEVI